VLGYDSREMTNQRMLLPEPAMETERPSGVELSNERQEERTFSMYPEEGTD